MIQKSLLFDLLEWSSSPFLLNATIKHHVEKYCSTHPEIVKVLMQSIYVDDVVSGADCDDDAYTLYETSKEILSHASFNLRKFATNSSTLQDRINREETPQKINSSQQINLPHVEALEESYVEATLPTEITNGPGEQRILGICWRVQLDQPRRSG